MISVATELATAAECHACYLVAKTCPRLISIQVSKPLGLKLIINFVRINDTDKTFSGLQT